MRVIVSGFCDKKTHGHDMLKAQESEVEDF
jgi:hypothetical protein